MKRTTLVLTAILALALLTLAACGGDDSPTPSPSSAQPAGSVDPNATATKRATRVPAATAAVSVQPCSLLNVSDVQGLIGAITSETPTAGQCQYTGDTGILTVHVEKADSVDAATQKLTETAGLNAESASITDAGFYVSDSEIAGRRGVYVFTITSTKPAKDALLSFAQSAAGNLPSS